MKTPDKQWSQQKDKDRNKAERDTMRKQQKSQQRGDGQQGDWNSDQDMQKGNDRKPPVERDRDYDPDGDRIGR